MIPATNQRSVQLNGAVMSGEFGISLDDSAHIMTILRDTLYSDKILAVLREYSANAWDANREAGRGDVPIEVTLPTQMEQTLTIKDSGPGLSRDGVFKVYTQYGKSTKRDSDQAVGMLGIGSKSGFAYADSFTIISCHGGTRSTYVAVLDESEKGTVNLLHEEPCGDETGVTIQMAVQPDDIHEFQRKARELFKYFNPRPKTNIDIPELPREQSSLKAGVIFHDADWEYRGFVAVMGCVSYRVNLDQIARFEEGIPSFVRDLAGALFFDIGEVHINASREELKYSNQTKRALIDRINALVEEYVRQTLDAINTEALSPWEKRLRAQVLSKFQLVVPKEYEELIQGYIRLNGKMPNTFRFYQYMHRGNQKQATEHISIRPETRIVLRDDNRTIKGYQTLTHSDYILRREWRNLSDDQAKSLEKPTWEQVAEDLANLLTTAGMLGVKVVKMSELPWTPPEKLPGSFNVKHKLKVFRWNPGGSREFKAPYSDYWEPEERVPTDDDVFVEINAFKALRIEIMKSWRDDSKIAEAFGKTLPTIYGYKVRENDPPVKRQGTHYKDWRENFWKQLIQEQAFKDRYESWMWFTEFNDEYSYSYRRRDTEYLDKLKESLGDQHPVVTFFQAKEDNYKLNRKDENRKDHSAIQLLADSFPKELDPQASQVRTQLSRIYASYPLFSIPDITLSVLRGEHLDKWVQYITTLDKGQNP